MTAQPYWEEELHYPELSSYVRVIHSLRCVLSAPHAVLSLRFFLPVLGILISWKGDHAQEKAKNKKISKQLYEMWGRGEWVLCPVSGTRNSLDCRACVPTFPNALLKSFQAWREDDARSSDVGMGCRLSLPNWYVFGQELTLQGARGLLKQCRDQSRLVTCKMSACSLHHVSGPLRILRFYTFSGPFPVVLRT